MTLEPLFPNPGSIGILTMSGMNVVIVAQSIC